MMRASLGLRWMRDMARTGQSGRRTVDARRTTVNPGSRALRSTPGPPLPVAGNNDNRFHQAVGRVPDIEEDESPYRLLVGDYASHVRT